MALTLKHNAPVLLLITLVAGIVFIPFIGNSPLFDWDEVNFAECAREMVVSGNYSQVQINYQPFWEKPPFFIWLQAASMNIFGVGEFAARFPNALCGIASLIAIYLIGRNFHSPRFGLTWCLLYAASLLPHFYFKSGIIDPWFNLFILLSVYQGFRLFNNPTGQGWAVHAVLSGLFLGLAVLTKGPAALVISALSLFAFMAWKRSLRLLLSPGFLVFALTTLLASGSWFLIEWLKGNQRIITEFIDYQVRLFQTGDAGHDGPFLYHFVVLLVGCFPASLVFMASYLKYRDLTPYQRDLRKIMLCLFWVVLLLFSIVKTKIIHYSSLCYFPLTFVACIGLVNYFDTLRFGKTLKAVYWLIAGTLTLAFTVVGFTDHFKGGLIRSGLIADKFAVMNLEADGHWTGFEFGIGLLLLGASVTTFMALRLGRQKLLYYGLGLHILFICFAIAVIVPKIELYTQHAAIEFYRERAKENCYVETHRFKSYAYLFYSNRRPGDYTSPEQVKYIKEQLDQMEKEGHSRLSSYPTSNLLWMEYGIIDRPAYIVVKTTEEHEITGIPGFIKLYQANGFSFFKREPGPPPPVN